MKPGARCSRCGGSLNLFSTGEFSGPSDWLICGMPGCKDLDRQRIDTFIWETETENLRRYRMATARGGKKLGLYGLR